MIIFNIWIGAYIQQESANIETTSIDRPLCTEVRHHQIRWTTTGMEMTYIKRSLTPRDFDIIRRKSLFLHKYLEHV